MAEDNTRKQCKKACIDSHPKDPRTTCKKECDAANHAANEDNTISGLGTPWCEDNAPTPSAPFCASATGKKKCKKTCKLCA